MNSLQIIDNKRHIVIEVTNEWPNKDHNLLVDHIIAQPDLFVTIPMPQMKRLLKWAFINANPKDSLDGLKIRVQKELNEANNIGHLRSILKSEIENIDFEIQCEKIITAYNKADAETEETDKYL